MSKDSYDHNKIEPKIQHQWAEANLYEIDLSDTTKDPYYLLVEFPYPSGDLHIGHWYAFSVTDIFARYLRMAGKNVLFPFGFDAFGLPAENAAIKNGLDPKEWTYQNMERMREQMKKMGASFDLSKEIITCEPEYYKWTQWLFTKLFEHNLAEHRMAAVKWCPKDMTVLANEQVIDGHCERCGTLVEERNLTQWFLKITQYAKRLLDDLESLAWPREIKEAQKAWIGESEGARITFPLQAEKSNAGSVEVFTTRPDTIFGATYLVIAPENPLVETLMPSIRNPARVDDYRQMTTRKTERERSENKEKTGVQLEGIMAINPANDQEIPVYLADYVLASYGTGAVMAVPAHDERDFEFAKKFKLPIAEVVASPKGVKKEAYLGDGTLMNSASFDGRNNRDALWDIVQAVGGERVTNYRIRDWLVSRQRYWGCPIPVVYDPQGEPHAIPAEHLPWLLPTDVDFTPTGKSPLATSKELHERVERIFGEGWTPEYDTLDVFVDSSWYFTRYLDPHDEHAFSDQALMKRWLPVNRYSGGAEHTTVHLLYSRFFYKALYDLALVPTSEPYLERLNRGLVLGTDGQKMSKRWGNVVNPDEMVEKFGADAVRVYLAFIGPYNEPGNYPWNLDGVVAMRRFLDRVVVLAEKVTDAKASDDVERVLSKTIEKIAGDSERFKFNTALSALMIALREFEKLPEMPRTVYVDFLKLLAPFAPHITDHLYQSVSNQEESIHSTEWPIAKHAGEQDAEVSVTIQINGKKRGTILLSPTASEDEARAAAEEIASVQAALEGKKLERAVYVPGRILNLVVTD